MITGKDGEKLACAQCIRGHRVAQCQHEDRELIIVSGKGRPVSQCGHCRTLRKSHSVHTRCKCASTAKSTRPGQDPCRCCEGQACTCAYKIDRSDKDSPPVIRKKLKSSSPRMDTLSPSLPAAHTQTSESSESPYISDLRSPSSTIALDNTVQESSLPPLEFLPEFDALNFDLTQGLDGTESWTLPLDLPMDYGQLNNSTQGLSDAYAGLDPSNLDSTLLDQPHFGDMSNYVSPGETSTIGAFTNPANDAWNNPSLILTPYGYDEDPGSNSFTTQPNLVLPPEFSNFPLVPQSLDIEDGVTKAGCCGSQPLGNKTKTSDSEGS